MDILRSFKMRATWLFSWLLLWFLCLTGMFNVINKRQFFFWLNVPQINSWNDQSHLVYYSHRFSILNLSGNAALRAAIRWAGNENFRFNDLRHTCVSIPVLVPSNFLRLLGFRPSACTLPASFYDGINETTRCFIQPVSALWFPVLH